jgi:hypothetical protein
MLSPSALAPEMEIPEELLSQIFSHVDSYDISQKFHLSQVCSRWRVVACGRPLFWTRLSIMTERSGSVPLDVQLLWYYRYKEVLLSTPERKGVAIALAACRHRIRSLIIDNSREKPHGLSPLLCAGLTFPMLEHFEFQGAEYEREKLSLSIHASTLKVLKLSWIGATVWSQLFGPCLQQLYLEACDTAAINLMDDILRNCPGLRSLLLRATPFNTGFSGGTIDAAGCAPDLKTLDLRADVNELVMLLRSSFSNLCLDRLNTSTFNGFVDDETKELIAEVLRNLDALQGLHLVDMTVIQLEDRAGRFRRIEVWNEDGLWEWPQVWLELAMVHGGRDTISKFRCHSQDWNTLAGAFNVCPPLAAGVEICIDLASDGIDDSDDFEFDETPVPDLEKAERGLRYLHCPNLRKLVFLDTPDYRFNSASSRWDVVRRLVRATQFEGSTVEYCISGAGLGDLSSSEQLCGQFEEVGSRWILCRHCLGKF